MTKVLRIVIRSLLLCTKPKACDLPTECTFVKVSFVTEVVQQLVLEACVVTAECDHTCTRSSELYGVPLAARYCELYVRVRPACAAIEGQLRTAGC